MSPDPILLSPADVVAAAASGTTYAAYSYAGNNPIAFTDPSGLLVDVGDDAVLGYYLHLLLTDSSLSGQVGKMVTDESRVFSIRQVAPNEANHSGAGGQPMGTNDKGQEVYSIKLNFEKAQAQRSRADTYLPVITPLQVMAHEMGHQFSRAYEDNSVGVPLPNGVVEWRHYVTAIDWENAVRPRGDPARPYTGGRSGMERHALPLCPPVPLACRPPR